MKSICYQVDWKSSLLVYGLFEALSESKRDCQCIQSDIDRSQQPRWLIRHIL